jgi:hypothetical protein
MAFKVNYDATTNILLISALTIENVEESIAIDALRVVFQGLYEVSERLEHKLLVKSTGKNLIGDSTDTSSIAADIWMMIDGVRRLELILTHIPKSIIPKSLHAIFQDIKNIRDSFQHIDERIGKYFSQVGGSVFGEIIWRSREKLDVREWVNYISTGISRIQVDPELPSAEKEFNKNVGVYDLSILYVSRDFQSKRHSKVIVNLDVVVGEINNLIESLELHYSRLYEKLDKNKQTLSKPSVHVQFRLKDEVFTKELKKFKDSKK